MTAGGRRRILTVLLVPQAEPEAHHGFGWCLLAMRASHSPQAREPTVCPHLRERKYGNEGLISDSVKQ